MDLRSSSAWQVPAAPRRGIRRPWVVLLTACALLAGGTAARAQDIEPRAYSNAPVGVSLQVSAPVGQYDGTRLVNIGTNRWFFKPEVGISKRTGRWTWEGAFAVTLFTTDHDFFGGNTREQDPLYSVQGHAIYSFRGGAWSSFDVTYFAGGSTTVNGGEQEDRQENWRVGTTLTLPLNPRNSIKFYLSDGVSARTGNNFLMAGVAWQYGWGGGL